MMKSDHLTSKQVEQYCQTGYLGSGERAHLASCPQCQRLASDLRVIGRLMASDAPARDEKHPGRDELQAYHDEALGFGQMKEVEAHLATCDHCLARLMELRVLDADLTHSTPTPRIIKAAQKQFRTPGRVRQLGRLIISTIRDTGKVLVTLEPVPAVSSGSQLFKNDLLQDRAQVDWMPSETKELRDDFEATYLPRESMQINIRYARSTRSHGDTIQTESGDHRIRISVSREEDSLLLHLSLSTREGDTPAQNLRVHLYADEDLSTKALTDQAGSSVLPLPAGQALLQIDADPPIQLSIAGTD